MAGTYSQVQIQVVFAVKNKDNLLDSSWRSEVFQFISGIITAKGQKSLIVNGVADHVHVFIGLRPSMRISDLVRDIKNNSSRFIDGMGKLSSTFQWQEGYGVFSYSESQIEAVYNYIINQESHHRRKTFREEYLEFLERFRIEYDPKYLFDWLE